MEKIASHISFLLVSNHIVNKEKREIYQYGAELALNFVTSIASILLIGVLYGQLAETAAYSLCWRGTC